MEAKVRRWGNSLGLRIPKALAEEAGIEADSAVDLTVRNGEIVVRPQRRRKFKLKDLLAKVTDENKHEEIDFGPPVGKEVW